MIPSRTTSSLASNGEVDTWMYYLSSWRLIIGAWRLWWLIFRDAP